MSNFKTTLYGGELYEHDKPLYGQTLIDEIKADVKRTQTLAGINLPDKLFITQKQYLSIENDTTAIGEKERMYNTGLNVMEVYVVDRKQEELEAVAELLNVGSDSD
jgi:hypothetical protein